MLFWNFYALLYSGVQKLLPYQDLIAAIKRVVAQAEPSGPVLDAGCGNGILSDVSAKYCGVDYSVSMLQVAKTKSEKAFFVRADLNAKLPFDDSSFSLCVCNNVLAYLKNPNLMLVEVFRVLKADGIFVLSTLRASFNPLHILSEHISQSSIWDVVKNIHLVILLLLMNRRIVQKLQTGVYRGFEKDELIDLARKTGFEIVSADHAYAKQNIMLVVRKPNC